MKTLIIVLAFVSSLFSNQFWDGKVHSIGSIEYSIKYGDLTPKLSLKTLENKENLYALGFLSSLKGEVQIFDSKAFIATSQNGQISIDNSFSKSAAFLIYTEVASWESFSIPNTIYTKKQLEEFIEKTADEYGIDTYEEFPFLIEGKIKSNRFVVRNWYPKESIDSEEEETCASCSAEDRSKLPIKVKYLKSSIEKTILDKDIKILGFYSPFKRGTLTYATNYTHINFISKDKKQAGHIQNMMLGKDMILKLPKIK